MSAFPPPSPFLDSVAMRKQSNFSYLQSQFLYCKTVLLIQMVLAALQEVLSGNTGRKGEHACAWQTNNKIWARLFSLQPRTEPFAKKCGPRLLCTAPQEIRYTQPCKQVRPELLTVKNGPRQPCQDKSTSKEIQSTGWGGTLTKKQGPQQPCSRVGQNHLPGNIACGTPLWARRERLARKHDLLWRRQKGKTFWTTKSPFKSVHIGSVYLLFKSFIPRALNQLIPEAGNNTPINKNKVTIRQDIPKKQLKCHYHNCSE